MTRLQIVKWEDAELKLRSLLKAEPHGGKKDMAQTLGMSQTHLSQLISGKRPMTRQIGEAVAAHYGMKLDYTFTADPTPAPPSRGEGEGGAG